MANRIEELTFIEAEYDNIDNTMFFVLEHLKQKNIPEKDLFPLKIATSTLLNVLSKYCGKE